MNWTGAKKYSLAIAASPSFFVRSNTAAMKEIEQKPGCVIRCGIR